MDGGTKRTYRLVVELNDGTTINVSSYSSAHNAAVRILAIATELARKQRAKAGRVSDKYQSIVQRLLTKVTMTDLANLDRFKGKSYTFETSDEVPGVRSMKLVKSA